MGVCCCLPPRVGGGGVELLRVCVYHFLHRIGQSAAAAVSVHCSRAESWGALPPAAELLVLLVLLCAQPVVLVAALVLLFLSHPLWGPPEGSQAEGGPPLPPEAHFGEF